MTEDYACWNCVHGSCCEGEFIFKDGSKCGCACKEAA